MTYMSRSKHDNNTQTQSQQREIYFLGFIHDEVSETVILFVPPLSLVCCAVLPRHLEARDPI